MEWCVTCPAKTHRVGQFDVFEVPRSETYFDSSIGCRIGIETGVPMCVHPDRIGLPPGAYASVGEPVPAVRLRRTSTGRRYIVVPPPDAAAGASAPSRLRQLLRAVVRTVTRDARPGSGA